MSYPLTTEKVKTLDQATIDQIINAGVPIEIYTNGFINLGANNKSALSRLSSIGYKIIHNNLPLPPSPFVEFIVDRTTGRDKQDFIMTMDGRRGSGKSYSGASLGEWYAILMAEKYGQDPKDYFSLDNCALLEDVEGISKLIDEMDKQVAILIDDAGVAVGARDFNTIKNKNFNKVMAICRTKRWFVCLNSPSISHLDLQLREMVDAKAHVYKPFHDLGLNILKINSQDVRVTRNKKYYYERRMSFKNKKFDFWIAVNPDYFDPYTGFAEAYDKKRDDAANKLIHETYEIHQEMSNPTSKRDKTRQQNFEKYFPIIKKMRAQNPPAAIRAIEAKVPLNGTTIRRFMAMGGIE